ncbi:sugar phosphate isomerase/epimerase family protein [Streptomyces sp. NPDC002328]|uniref:sugar phosphate isomerase/epimerase family protein n=1 Tax=Streptomyces sp. NPDC002328 TaxID=3364642 RepID=UPI0036B2A471
MSGARATLRLTFDGLRRSQIDTRWARELGGLEAYVFDGDDLVHEDQWRTLGDNLRYASDVGARALTLHFPTENADWVADRDAYDRLRRFCDLAAETGAQGVVLHANQFVSLADWPAFDLAGARARVVDRIAELDAHLGDAPIWIGVENMPVIGAQGIDFDSVFVRPSDFAPLAALGSDRVGVTWDVCHWAVTYSTLTATARLEQRPDPVPPFELPALPLKHVHFSSFSGHAMPTWPDQCREGVPPLAGDVPPDLLAGMLAAALDAAIGDAEEAGAARAVGVVFEVQESDYESRKNCWETYDWLASVPELAARVDCTRSGDA